MPSMPEVTSIEDKDRLMGRCACAGEWRLRGNALWPRTGHWVDELDVVCAQCGIRRSFAFDVTAFFKARPGVWATARAFAHTWGTVDV